MSASHYFGMPNRHTRSTAATMSAMSSTPPSLSVAEHTNSVPALVLGASPANPMDAMNKVPKHSGDYVQDYDEHYGKDDGKDDGGDGIRNEGMDRTGGEDYGVSAGATSVIVTKGKATGKFKFGRFTEEASRYDEDDDDDDGRESYRRKDNTEGEEDNGSTEDTPIGGIKGKGKRMATDKRTSKGDTKEIPSYDEGYDEDDHEDDGGGGSAEDTPALGPKGKGKGKATDKRKFGGSSKGRKCYRWTVKQEKAAIAGMLQIRAEGEIVGDACFEELYKRLLSKDPAWNHSVSGIHNAWHRRDLVQHVIRAEAKAKQEKHQQQAKEDTELGLAFRSKLPLKRKSSAKSAILAKYEENDEESMFVSKRRRTDSPRRLLGTNFRNLDTTFSRDLPAPNVSTSSATMSSDLPILDFFTVTIGFKRYNNNSRRTREFAEVNTLNRFWNQVVATPMFNNLETAFMVVSVWVGAARKPHYMAQHDKADYADFVQLVEKAVDASGEEEVIVNVTAAL